MTAAPPEVLPDVDTRFQYWVRDGDNPEMPEQFRIVGPGLLCYVCEGDAELGAVCLVRPISDGFSIGIGVCKACVDGAGESVRDLLIRTVDKWKDDQAAAAGIDLFLPRRRRPLFTRKRPSYAKRLEETPPPPGEPIKVVLDWKLAEQFTPPVLVVNGAESPGLYRFDVCAGRHVRVAHPHTTPADWLRELAQVLIDDGATQVELWQHPPAPSNPGGSVLRIRPA